MDTATTVNPKSGHLRLSFVLELLFAASGNRATY